MKFPLYTSDSDKMSLLERWILVHCIIYYDREQNFVDDTMFDNNSKQLLEMMKDIRSFKDSRYYKTFKTFKGSTGFDLESRCKKCQPEEHALLLRIVKEVLDGQEKR